VAAAAFQMVGLGKRAVLTDDLGEHAFYSRHSFSTGTGVVARTLTILKNSSFRLTVREIVRTALLPA